MQVSKLNPRIIILSFFFVIFLGLCSKTEGRAQEPRGVIRVVESWRPDITILGHNVLQYLYEYALDRNELVPCLAVSRKWVDDTTLELKLREGVKFHNGESFDAYAVKFNFDYQRKHNPGRGVQVYMKDLRELRVIDSHTIHMVLDQPDSLILDKLITGPIAGWTIGAPRYMEEVGWDEFLKHPTGTGPYMIKGEVKDFEKVAEGEAYATLVANPDYWNKGYPKISRISAIRYSPKGAVGALTENHLDLVTPLIPKDTLRVEESPHSKVVKGRDDVRFTSVFLNLMSPHTIPLRDMRVRKALNYAVNREELIRYGFRGNALMMRGYLTEKAGVDLSGTEAYEWNIPKARALLKEAGFEKGFRLKLFYVEHDFLIAMFLQRFYRLLGIEVEMSSVEFEWIVRHLVYPNTREGYPWEDQDWWIIIYSQPCPVPEIVYGVFEWTARQGAPFKACPDWLVFPLEEMYREVLKTTDRNRRFEIYKKANEYMADQALWIFPVAALGLYGVNEELQFVPQIGGNLYLEYSSVTDNHRSVKGRNN